jgi:hypothetical protein
MKRVTTAVQGGQPELVTMNDIEKFGPTARVGKKAIQITMRRRGKVAGSDLNGLNAKPAGGLKCLDEGEMKQTVGEESDFHSYLSPEPPAAATTPPTAAIS